MTGSNAFTTPSAGGGSSSNSSIRSSTPNNNNNTNEDVNVEERVDKNQNLNPFYDDGEVIDLELLLEAMNNLKEDQLPPVTDKYGKIKSRKKFMKSYKAKSFSDDHRKKSADFWDLLEQNTQQSVRSKVVNDTLRKKDAAARDASVIGERSATTTANNLVRLLHILYDVNNVGAIARALEKTQVPKTREKLDARNSEAQSINGGTMAEDQDGWAELAAEYNNPENKYWNKCVNLDYVNGQLVYLCSDPMYQGIFNFVKELDPDLPENPTVRDGKWIKTYTNKLKGQINLVYNNFMRSGNHDGRYTSLAADWLKDVEYVTRMYDYCGIAHQQNISADVIMYALVFIDQEDLMSIGKTIGNGDGIDDDVVQVIPAVTTETSTKETKTTKKRGRDRSNTIDTNETSKTAGASDAGTDAMNKMAEQRVKSDMMSSKTAAADVILASNI